MYIRPLWSCGGEWTIKWKWYHALIRKDLPTNQPDYFEWTLAERDITFIFFASFGLICQRSPLKKKSSGHWEAREAQNRYLRREVRKETDIGEGMGGELRVREKNTLHALQVRYLHLIETRNTVNLYITRKSFTRIEKEKSIWKQEVS